MPWGAEKLVPAEYWCPYGQSILLFLYWGIYCADQPMRQFVFHYCPRRWRQISQFTCLLAVDMRDNNITHAQCLHSQGAALPPLPPIESGDTYARSPITWTPLSRGGGGGGRYTPYLGYWLPLAITQTFHFLWLSQEIFQTLCPKIPPPPPLPENMGTCMHPPYVFKWGGGGGRQGNG